MAYWGEILIGQDRVVSKIGPYKLRWIESLPWIAHIERKKRSLDALNSFDISFSLSEKICKFVLTLFIWIDIQQSSSKPTLGAQHFIGALIFCLTWTLSFLLACYDYGGFGYVRFFSPSEHAELVIEFKAILFCRLCQSSANDYICCSIIVRIISYTHEQIRILNHFIFIFDSHHHDQFDFSPFAANKKQLHFELW